jgi:hypothetical protein
MIGMTFNNSFLSKLKAWVFELGRTFLGCKKNGLCLGARETVDDVSRTDESLCNGKTNEAGRSETK